MPLLYSPSVRAAPAALLPSPHCPQGLTEAVPRGRACAVDITSVGLSGVKGWMDKLIDSCVNGKVRR